MEDTKKAAKRSQAASEKRSKAKSRPTTSSRHSDQVCDASRALYSLFVQEEFEDMDGGDDDSDQHAKSRRRHDGKLREEPPSESHESVSNLPLKTITLTLNCASQNRSHPVAGSSQEVLERADRMLGTWDPNSTVWLMPIQKTYACTEHTTARKTAEHKDDSVLHSQLREMQQELASLRAQNKEQAAMLALQKEKYKLTEDARRIEQVRLCLTQWLDDAVGDIATPKPDRPTERAAAT